MHACTRYINSTGSTIKNNTRYIGESKVGLETDAFAIADCMQYIKPKVNTIAIGQAYGTAAMLLGLGTKGNRFALPNSTIMLFLTFDWLFHGITHAAA